MSRALTIIVSGIILTACASSGPKRPEWTRAAGQPMDQVQFNRDHYECQKENSYHYRGVGALVGPFSEQIKVDKDLYRACMRNRGWVHAED
ncbi:MAG TPA: hypothetical protein VGX21_18455 [Methylomirabilota bacterium]|nr:hypothetical protein [Methylomirabilota bacterium]